MLANVFDITSCFRLSPPWEGDVFSDFSGHHTNDFNPRPPWGGRLQKYTNIQYCVCT